MPLYTTSRGSHGECRAPTRNSPLVRSERNRKRSLLRALAAGLLLCTSASAAVAQSSDLFTEVSPVSDFKADSSQGKYIDQIQKRPSTGSLSIVRVNLDALKGETIRLALPNSDALMVQRSDFQSNSKDSFTWSGAPTGQPGVATLVVRNGNVTGTIRDNSELFRIEPIGDGAHALVRVNASGFPPEEPPISPPTKGQRGDLNLGEPANKKEDGPVEIDVLVPYTSAARSSVLDISSLIQLAIDETNQAYKNSQINIAVKLVGTLEVGYAEKDKTYDQILADLKNMQVIMERRDSTGADLVALIVNQNSFCGMADAIMADASSAFASVYYDCATGYYSFAHELAHLQGARHDPQNDSSHEPFSYGHGYQHPSEPVFRTIMAYPCQNGCNREQHFSNPRVLYHGVPTGDPICCDNARVLNETAATIGSFRPPSGM